MWVMLRTFMPAIVFFVTSTADVVGLPDAGELGVGPDSPAPGRAELQWAASALKFVAVSAQGSTLTETIAGRSRRAPAAASLRMLASRGQKSRQSGSMNVTIAGRPCSDARLKLLPCSSSA